MRKEAFKVQDVLIIMLNKQLGVGTWTWGRKRGEILSFTVGQPLSKRMTAKKKKKYINENLQRSFTSQVFTVHSYPATYDTEEKINLVMDDNLVSASEIHLSQTTMNVDYLTPFLLIFVRFLPRDKSYIYFLLFIQMCAVGNKDIAKRRDWWEYRDSCFSQQSLGANNQTKIRAMKWFIKGS